MSLPLQSDLPSDSGEHNAMRVQSVGNYTRLPSSSFSKVPASTSPVQPECTLSHPMNAEREGRNAPFSYVNPVSQSPVSETFDLLCSVK